MYPPDGESRALSRAEVERLTPEERLHEIAVIMIQSGESMNQAVRGTCFPSWAMVQIFACLDPFIPRRTKPAEGLANIPIRPPRPQDIRDIPGS